MSSAKSPLPPLPLPKDISQNSVSCAANGLTFHILEAGYGPERTKPLLLLLHGFPELAFSWRKVMPSLAEAGYYVACFIFQLVNIDVLALNSGPRKTVDLTTGHNEKSDQQKQQ